MRLACLVLLAACARRERDVDPLPPLLRAADVAWDNRVDGGLEAVAEPLEQAYALRPDAPEVLWRLVRHRHATSTLEETERARIFTLAEARSLGLRCLDNDPRFAEHRRDGRWAEAANDDVVSVRSPCRAWTALVWARWIDAIGPEAAGLDAAAALALAHAAAGDPDTELAAVGAWSLGLLHAVVPAWAGGEPNLVERSFRTAAASPYRRWVWVDMARFAPAPLGEEAEAWLDADPPVTPEERAARRVPLGGPG